MRILHTADWHIGQTLSGFSREAEHAAFLEHLGQVIVDQQVDALLVAGDVFDGVNPSGEAQRLLYSALARFLRLRPGLTIVMIAGNHDPALRLEAPEAVLRELGVHVVGTMRDIGHHLIPLSDATGVKAYVLAIPFLRSADLPGHTMGATGGNDVVTATRALHHALTAAALPMTGGLPLIAMGHLTCAGGLMSEGAERHILIGGEHAVPPDIYPPEIAYVALGHLHKPQNLDGGRVRYSGSPFPLSASEIPYDHGVTLIELTDTLTHHHIPLPRPVPCLRLPARGAASVTDLPALLAALPLDPTCPLDLRPFVHVTLTPDRPASQLRAEAEALLDAHPIRVASLIIDRPITALPDTPPPSLAQTNPQALFIQAFQAAQGLPPDPRHLAAFAEAMSRI